MINKKASLKLTLIIIGVGLLILALVLLSIGLLKKHNQTYSSIIGPVVQSPMVDEMKSKGEIIYIAKEFKVESGHHNNSYLGIRSNESTIKNYWLNWVCESRLDNTSGIPCSSMNNGSNFSRRFMKTKGQWNFFNTFNYVSIYPGQAKFLILKIQPRGTANTYKGKIVVYESDMNITSPPDDWANPNANGTETYRFYAESKFNLTVLEPEEPIEPSRIKNKSYIFVLLIALFIVISLFFVFRYLKNKKRKLEM